MFARVLFIICLLFSVFSTPTLKADSRQYTAEHPLVYEDPVNQWPFSFINEQGQPDGFNIELLRMLMEELRIPYVVRMKPHQEVLKDMRDRQSDLTLGPKATFYDSRSLYSRHAIILLTQSVATPRNCPVTIHTFRDLGRKGQQVVVNESSICHHLLRDYGWQSNAIVSSDMSKSLLEVNASGRGQIVWNTFSLEWLIRHHHLDNLTVSPVNMPHGEYRYMSHDPRLLSLIDKAYAKLQATGRLAPLEEKWFFRPADSQPVSAWTWILAVVALSLLAVAVLCIVRVAMRYRRIRESDRRLVREIGETLHGGKVRLWTYRVGSDAFAWLDEHGKAGRHYRSEQFAKRYNKDDFKLLMTTLDHLVSQHADSKGHKLTKATIELKARDVEFGDEALRDFVVVLSVLRHAADGKPTVILAAKKDVTQELRLKQKNIMRSLRYWSVFYNDQSGIICFGKDGAMEHANPEASTLFLFDADELVRKGVHINEFLQTSFTHLRDADGYRGVRTVNNHVVHYQLKVVYSDTHELIGIFLFCI